jgi:transcriptional regulator with XRE-family HTH domain
MYIMSTKTVTPEQERHRKEFGLRLRQLRETHREGKKSQAWLAEQMKLDRRTVMRLEAGKVPVELHLIAAANKALGCGIGPLLESLLNGEEVTAETERQLLHHAAYQRARVQKERLDLALARYHKAIRAEMEEATRAEKMEEKELFGDTDRQLKELEARFKQ